MTRWLIPGSVVALVLLIGACLEESSPTAAPTAETSIEAQHNRIISLNGSLTELLFTLGYGKQVVGVDVTSTYPAQDLVKVPRLGHTSQLNIEGLLALKPSLVVIDADQRGATDVLEKLRAANIEVLEITVGQHLSSAVTAAKALSKTLAIPSERLAALTKQIAADSIELDNYLAQHAGRQPRTLFLYARGAGRIMVGGRGTPAEQMIQHAGAINAADVDQFANLTPEGVVAANPDALLLFESGLEKLNDGDGLAGVPGLPATPAMQNNRVIAMDGHYLLGFGPRAAAAALELAQRLRGEVPALTDSPNGLTTL